MRVSLSELKQNVGKYVDLAGSEDIIITRNGKPAARIVGAKPQAVAARVAAMKSLFGILPAEAELGAARSERLERYEK